MIQGMYWHIETNQTYPLARRAGMERAADCIRGYRSHDEPLKEYIERLALSGAIHRKEGIVYVLAPHVALPFEIVNEEDAGTIEDTVASCIPLIAGFGQSQLRQTAPVQRQMHRMSLKGLDPFLFVKEEKQEWTVKKKNFRTGQKMSKPYRVTIENSSVYAADR